MYLKSASSVNAGGDVRPVDKLIGESADGEVYFSFDASFLGEALQRLTLAECGIVSRALAGAVVAKDRSVDQLALLLLFAHWGGSR